MKKLEPLTEEQKKDFKEQMDRFVESIPQKVRDSLRADAIQYFLDLKDVTQEQAEKATEDVFPFLCMLFMDSMQMGGEMVLTLKTMMDKKGPKGTIGFNTTPPSLN